MTFYLTVQIPEHEARDLLESRTMQLYVEIKQKPIFSITSVLEYGGVFTECRVCKVGGCIYSLHWCYVEANYNVPISNNSHFHITYLSHLRAKQAACNLGNHSICKALISRVVTVLISPLGAFRVTISRCSW